MERWLVLTLLNPLHTDCDCRGVVVHFASNCCAFTVTGIGPLSDSALR